MDNNDKLCIIKDNVITVDIDDISITLPFDKYKLFCKLVNSAMLSNIGCAYIDKNDNLIILQKRTNDENDI